jgi:xylan 1,4-beta-xylosidase
MFANPHRTTVFAHRSRRLKIYAQSIVIFMLVIATLMGVSQLPVVREFFGRASGEKANIRIDTTAIIGLMPRPWRNLAQGGEEAGWRLQPISAQVKALNPRYIRLDHIFDFYEIVKGSPGNLSFDFSKFDLIIDDILATGAKPYIALSYMPPAIAGGDIVSAPTNYADWQLVVQRTIEHVSGKRGIRDVYYEVWNEPDLFGGWKYYGAKNYLTLYTYASNGAKAAKGVQPFKLGGPVITALYKNWFDAMAKHAIANNLKYDFFSWHRYNHNVGQYKKDMMEVKSWLQAYPQLEPTLELHISEWGHDSQNHAGYDSGYGAAHTVAGAIEMVGVVDNAFVFEIQDGRDAGGQDYWGRWGLFTHKDAGAVPKPRYWALKMLDSIGTQRLQLLGKGSWVKGLAGLNSQGTVQVVLANYDVKGAHTENVPITFTNIKPGTFTITKTLLNGQKKTQTVATSEAQLATFFSMPPNSVGMVELARK